MAESSGPIGPLGPLPPGLLPPPPSIFGGGPGRKGPSGWAQLAILVGVVALATAGWSIWSIVNVSSGPAPRPPIAVPSPTGSSGPPTTRRTTTSPSPTTSSTTAPSRPSPTPSPTTPGPTLAPSPSSTTPPTPTPTPSRSPSDIGQPVGRATQVAPTPLPVPTVGTQPANVRFDVASSASATTGDVSYGSNSDADVEVRNQPMPFSVEVTVPRDTGYVFVLGSHDGSAGTGTTMRCRVYVNSVLVGEELSRGSCIVGIDISNVFNP